MKYIIQALRTTYYTERKVYPGLNDLINMLEEETNEDGFFDYLEVTELILTINKLLHDINLPKEGT